MLHACVRSLALVSVLALHVAAAPAAQPSPDTARYPVRPIRILVGFTPGGGPDITARYVAQKLTESWKQQVVVDNRPGAGGTVAAATAASATPDGYTLLSVSSAHAVAPAIYAKLPYELKDLSGITMTATSKYVLVVATSFPAKSVKD
jgi:tripartite-type tricarboxylate transporter receptor subunit TctC